MVAWKGQAGASAIDFRERSKARTIARLLQPTRRMVAMGLIRIGAGVGFGHRLTGASKLLGISSSGVIQGVGYPIFLLQQLKSIQQMVQCEVQKLPRLKFVFSL